MKHLSFVFSFVLVLAMTIGTARADLSIEVREVTADSGTFESGMADRVPDGFTAWQLIVDTNVKWVGSQLDVELTEGTILLATNSLLRNVSAGGAHLPPNAAFYAIPDDGLFVGTNELPFVSHVSAPGVTGAGQRRAPAPTPNPLRAGDVGHTLTPTVMITDWVDPDPLSDDSVPGVHVIGMITLSDDAAGTFLLRVVDTDTVDQKDPPRPANPAIIQAQIIEGHIVIPEPTTFVLAALGMMGLGFIRRRRRA